MAALTVAISKPHLAAGYKQLREQVRQTLLRGKSRAQDAVEREKVRTSWEIGKLILDHILLHKERAQYGAQVLKRLSKDLGISDRELRYMVEFARTYPNLRTSAKLSWSDYQALLRINDDKARQTVANRAEKGEWSTQQLRREIRKQKARDALSSSNEFVGDPLLDIKPGPLDTYQIIRLKDRLKIDLGFGIYHDFPEKQANKFKEGEMVEIHSAPKHQGTTPPGKVFAGAQVLLRSGARQRTDLFTYNAKATRVVDGDTFHALIDLGFGITMAQRVRLRRIDAPEIMSAEGLKAKTCLEKILFRDKGRILIHSRKLDQHGRPIADVWVKGKSIDGELLGKGLTTRVSE